MFDTAIRSSSTVALWFDEAGMPVRLVWRGRRWRVSDTPTSLADLLEVVTHPPALEGWRFQISAVDDGESRVVDVIRSADGEWVIARSWR